jgi:uncharacterized protein
MEIFKAIAENNLERFLSLLGGDRNLANARNEQGVSALLLTLYYRRGEMTRPLIEAGSVAGLFEAAALGDTARIAELLAGNPDSVNSFSADGFQALGLAAFFGHAHAAEYLIEHGADLDRASDNGQRVAPLHSAAASNSLRIVASLVKHGANVNVRQQGGHTPLHEAVHNGNREMVELLLRNGADCGARTEAGLLPSELPGRKNPGEVDKLLAHCVEPLPA